MCASICQTCAETINSATGVADTCLSCFNGYNYADGVCFQCSDPLALTCSPTNAAYSLSCVPGYNAENGACNACASNCNKCGSRKSGSCDQGGCIAGFFQAKGFSDCVQCFGGCLVCNNDPNVCTKCGDQQYLSNNKCLPCGSNCLVCTNDTTCTSCNLGYLVTSTGSCRAPNVDNCVKYDSYVNCIKCDYNYALTSGSCVL
jgi:proprotein convertase subtilisin/kexin type 5